MRSQLSRRRFLEVAATASGSVIAGFDPQARAWVLKGEAGFRPFEQVPKLDGTLLYDHASRSAMAGDGGNIVHRMPAAVLKPGSVRDVVSTIQYATGIRLVDSR